MPICNCCRKHFDVEDFMDGNITESSVCPDCYYGGNMIDDGFDEYDEDAILDDIDDDSYEDEDSRVIREALGGDLGYDESDEEFDDDEFSDDEDDYEDRLDIEEGDYE